MGEGNKGVARAIALRSSGTVVGFEFHTLGVGNIAYACSPPMAGKVRLTRIVCLGSKIGDVLSFHRIQLAVGSEKVWSTADLNKEEQVFPAACDNPAYRSSLIIYYLAMPFQLEVSRVLGMNGRRILCGFRNGAAAVGTFYVGLVLEGVVFGEGRSRLEFLSGERLEVG